MLIELPWDLAVYGSEKRACSSPVALGIFSLLVGGLIGWLTLFVHPQALIQSGAVRMANLVVGPAVSAGVAWLMSRRRVRHGAAVNSILHAACAFCFTLGLVMVRFAYGHHPG